MLSISVSISITCEHLLIVSSLGVNLMVGELRISVQSVGVSDQLHSSDLA